MPTGPKAPKFVYDKDSVTQCTSIRARVGHGRTCYLRDINDSYCCIGTKKDGKYFMECLKGSCSEYNKE